MLYSKQIDIKETYDAVICGGGFSGFAAAYSAAREGLQTVLIERGSSLGGVGTDGLVNHILGERYYEDGKAKTCIAGLFAQIEDALIQSGDGIDYHTVDLELPPHGWKKSLGVGFIFDKDKMKLLLEQMLIGMGVHILYMTQIVDVIRQDGKLEGVIVHNKSGLYGIAGKYFVDATGDADICAMAGLETHKGDESGGLAAASLEMHIENVDWEILTEYMRTTGDVRFTNLIDDLKVRGIWHFPYEIFISVMLTKKDVFFINTIRQVGIDGTDAHSLTQGILQGRQECYELLQIAKAHFPGFQNATMRQIAPAIGIRETRRIIGEYTMTIEDLLAGTSFDDSIALSGYGWDMPNPKNPSYQPFHGVVRKHRSTQIPYRCLVPKGICNLITAGRCISVEREALGPVRVMAACIATGEAAGIATALALAEDTAYNKVDTDTLRQKIVAYGGLVDRQSIK